MNPFAGRPGFAREVDAFRRAAVNLALRHAAEDQHPYHFEERWLVESAVTLWRLALHFGDIAPLAIEAPARRGAA